MDFQDKQYVIGIDLGTTNSAVSYVDVAALKQNLEAAREIPDKNKIIKIFNVPQLTGHGEFTKNSVLPSFLYLPGEYDISKESMKHPWKKREDLFVGSFARDHGAKVPSRLVSSAKSWLCNPLADRKAKILPWGAAKSVEKISPVAVTAEYLNHIRCAWNYFVKDEDQFLENQFIVITVPASFNEEARELTMEAISLAGLGNSVTLLEEPLAAFYSWLILHEMDWQEHVREDDLILVCDVGGGTTDFSLIALKEIDGSPKFERLAVGDHLVLGGDNIDLALAKIVEDKFQSSSSLSPDRWKTLCHKCREAKEKILEHGERSVRITLRGEGRSLIAGTMAADLSRGDVENLIRGQFFSDVHNETLFEAEQGKEIADFGLPFERETSVTKHIVQFLETHKKTVKNVLGKEIPMPDLILFNGGTLKPAIIQSRVREATRRWFKTHEPNKPQILQNDRPDLAVGVGASYYGLVKQGVGVKVGSGSPRSYYLGIATPNSGTRQHAVCIVERGLDEGSVIDLPDMALEVKANQAVSFDVFSSSFRSGDTAGNVIEVDESLSRMMPIQTILRFGKSSDRKQIPITIGAEYTEMGSLAMFCRSTVSEHRWKLQFQLRNSSQTSNLESSESEIYDDALIDAACSKIEKAFSDPTGSGGDLKDIVRTIENIVKQRKANWPLTFLRRLADQMIDVVGIRVQSADLEARWLNLTGFCMRPGFGDAFDEDRIRKLWKIYLKGLMFNKDQRNRLEWWIFIRRIAGGLKAGQQRQFFQDTSSLLLKNSKTKLSPQELTELWMASGNMERLLVKDKVLLAKALIPQLKPGKKMERLFWVLSRFGARELLYGSIDRVLPPAEVARWIFQIMKKSWKPGDPVTSLLVTLSRKVGDRTRDLPEDLIKQILEWMTTQGVEKKVTDQLKEKVGMDIKQKHQQFGERLPSGLILK